MEMKIMLRVGIVAVALFTLASCASMQVGSNQHPQADFSAYKDYAWMADAPVAGATVQVSALAERHIRDAVEAGLAAKGYRQVDAREADFLVSFTVGRRDRMVTTAKTIPYRDQGIRDWSWLDVDVQTYEEGTLSIDIVDGASLQPVWHGWARKTITDADEADPGPVIRRAVARILEKM
jgi:hypothetical protein